MCDTGLLCDNGGGRGVEYEENKNEIQSMYLWLLA